jgi:hypothetical protein
VTADAAMNEWVLDNTPDSRTYMIEWHVDYWDSLGWPDPYASPLYTQRQQHYNAVISSSTMYTPDFWVHGEQAPLNIGLVENMINTWLDVPGHATVELTLASEPTDSPLLVDFEVIDMPEGSALYLVLVEGGLVSEVTAGENGGETLEHEAVARAFTQATGTSGQESLTPPEQLVPDNARIIGFVQDWSTLCMYGAAGIELVPPE